MSSSTPALPSTVRTFPVNSTVSLLSPPPSTSSRRTYCCHCDKKGCIVGTPRDLLIEAYDLLHARHCPFGELVGCSTTTTSGGWGNLRGRAEWPVISSAGGIAAVLYGILPGQFVWGGGFGGVVLLTSRERDG